jgi:hypothetical protein
MPNDRLTEKKFIELHGEERTFVIRELQNHGKSKNIKRNAVKIAHEKIMLPTAFLLFSLCGEEREHNSFLLVKKRYLEKYGSDEWARMKVILSALMDEKLKEFTKKH